MDENRPNEPEGQQPPPPQPPPSAPPAAEPGPPCRTSGMAIASLVLGILAVVTCVGAIIFAPIGLVLGIIGLIQTDRSRGCLRGHGLALAGTILSGISLLISPILAAILFPVFARAREKAQQTMCLSNARQLSSAMMMYQSDWDTSYPLASNWNESLRQYARPTKSSANTAMGPPWVCPAAKDKNLPSYAINDKLSGLRAAQVNSMADTVGIYESEPGKDLANGPTLFPSPPRHRQGNTVGFADGHVTSVEPTSNSRLIWDPASSATSPSGSTY